MSTYTPAPWTARFSTDSGYDCMTDAWLIFGDSERCHVTTVDLANYGQSARDRATAAKCEEAAANAHLIAAAPDLLSALKLAQAWLANCVPVAEPDGPKPLPIIAAAIAKAEGR